MIQSLVFPTVYFIGKRIWIQTFSHPVCSHYIASSLVKHFKISKAPGISSFQFSQWIASHFFSRNVYISKSEYRNFEMYFKVSSEKFQSALHQKKKKALAKKTINTKNYVVIGSGISNVCTAFLRIFHPLHSSIPLSISLFQLLNKSIHAVNSYASVFWRGISATTVHNCVPFFPRASIWNKSEHTQRHL